MNSTNRRSTLLRGAGGLAAVVGATGIALAAFATSAAAGGNPNFDGILSAAVPSGFMSSPEAYNVSGGPVTVDFNVVVTNLTDASQSVALNFSADQILTYEGTNVMDGQPGQAGITFTGPQGTTQLEVAGSQSFTQNWSPDQVLTMERQYTFNACGYYQLDIWAPVTDHTSGERYHETLASGFIQVLGCDGGGSGSPTPTPATTPTPTGSAQGVSTPSPSPEGGVDAITTPDTGAGGPGTELWIGVLLLGIGLALLIAGRRRALAAVRLPRGER